MLGAAKETLREMLDVMTFYKPISILADENKPITTSFISVVFVFALYAILICIASLGVPVEKLMMMASLLAVILIHLPLASILIYVISRVFSREGALFEVLSVNFFLSACASLFALVVFVPFAEFAGILLSVLSIALYFYFFEEAIERIFRISGLQSIILTLVYAAIIAGMLAFEYYVTGLKVPIV